MVWRTHSERKTTPQFRCQGNEIPLIPARSVSLIQRVKKTHQRQLLLLFGMLRETHLGGDGISDKDAIFNSNCKQPGHHWVTLACLIPPGGQIWRGIALGWGRRRAEKVHRHNINPACGVSNFDVKSAMQCKGKLMWDFGGGSKTTIRFWKGENVIQPGLNKVIRSPENTRWGHYGGMVIC